MVRIANALSRMSVRAVVLEVLNEVQAAILPAQAPAIEITDDTKPIDEIEMFDSVLAEDTMMTIFQRIGLTLNDQPNPFFENRRETTVRQVTDGVCKLAGIAEVA